MRGPFGLDTPNPSRAACIVRARRSALHDPSLGQDDKAFRRVRTPDDLHVHSRHDFLDGGAKQRTLIAAVGVELQQKRKHAERRRHDERAAVAILDVGGVHDGVNQQALRVDENVTLRP